MNLEIGNIFDDDWVFALCVYKGNGDFLNYISHHVESLTLKVNLDISNQLAIQDIINKICNKFLKLEYLYLCFNIAKTPKSYDLDDEVYKKK